MRSGSERFDIGPAEANASFTEVVFCEDRGFARQTDQSRNVVGVVFDADH